MSAAVQKGHHTLRATRVGNSIIQSDVRVAKVGTGRKLYEAVVELRKRRDKVRFVRPLP